MKPWIPLTLMLLTLLLAQGQRILSAPSEGPTPPRPPGFDNSPTELLGDSAIRCPIKPGGLPGTLGSSAFSSDCRLIAARDSDGVKVFDARSGRLIVSFPLGAGTIAFMPRGEALVAPTVSGEWALFDPATGKLLRAMDPVPPALAKFGVYDVAFSPDGKRLAGAYGNGEVVVWDVATGKRVRTLPPYIIPAWRRDPIIPGGSEINAPAMPAKVETLAFSPDGARLYAGGYVLRAWDLAATTEPRRFDLLEKFSCDRMALSSDGATVAVVDTNESIAEEPHSILLLDAATGRKKAEITTTTRAIQDVAFLPGSRVLVSLEGYRVVRLWDVATAKPIASCRFDQHFRLEELAVSPDGRRIAAAGQESDAIFGAIGMVETDGTKLGPWRPTP
jgi:WD40 repeat protein